MSREKKIKDLTKVTSNIIQAVQIPQLFSLNNEFLETPY